jgi:hypothetical protein
MSSSEIEKCVKKANICFLKDFLDAAVKCGEITRIGKERLKENKTLKDFFDEGRDEMVETLQDTVKELSALKARIKGDGLEYLLEDPMTDENLDKYELMDLLQNCSDDFIQISEFRGMKKGYTFKTGSQGTGYYKEGATFEESSDEEYLTECANCSRVWDGNAQCPCGMDQLQTFDEFEGRTTFPTENTDATNQFIIRYIAKEWQELTYMKKNYAGEVAYSITKRRTKEVPNSTEYILNGKGSCGIMSMDSDWGREGFIIDLKGKSIGVIKGFLQDLVNVYVPS